MGRGRLMAEWLRHHLYLPLANSMAHLVAGIIFGTVTCKVNEPGWGQIAYSTAGIVVLVVLLLMIVQSARRLR